MPIPESTLAGWSHHRSGTAPIQAHLAIREALAAYTWPQEVTYDVFLQGSYKNDTNLSGDSDVDVVIQLASRLRPRVAALQGPELLEDASHKVALERWQSFRRHASAAMRARFGDSVTSGRKSLKLAKGKLPASADLVVTLRFEEGLAFYLPDRRHWVVSYPQTHHQRGVQKEKATNNRFKRTIRMFKAARTQLIRKKLIDDRLAPSYFIECMLYNVPDRLFRETLSKTYEDSVAWLKTADLKGFLCQNGKVRMFGERSEQWTLDAARALVDAWAMLQRDWR